MEHRSKNKVFWRFSHIYWRNTYWKTSFFMCSGACLDELSKLFRVVFAKNTLSSSTFPLKFSKIFRKATFNYICSLFIPSSFCFSRSRKKTWNRLRVVASGPLDTFLNLLYLGIGPQILLLIIREWSSIPSETIRKPLIF